MYFYSNNPSVGRPYIGVTTDPGYNNGPTADLVEGESRAVTFGGHSFVLERRGDTDYKVMRLIAK